MRAVVCREFGPPERLEEVARALNDILQRRVMGKVVLVTE